MSGTPSHITLLLSSGTADAGSAAGAIFRVTDDTGVPVTDAVPDVKPVSGGGAVVAVRALGIVPYAYELDVRLGTLGGRNVFRIQVGNLTKDVTIIGQ